jgi:hypothetical protein
MKPTEKLFLSSYQYLLPQFTFVEKSLSYQPLQFFKIHLQHSPFFLAKLSDIFWAKHYLSSNSLPLVPSHNQEVNLLVRNTARTFSVKAYAVSPFTVFTLTSNFSNLINPTLKIPVALYTTGIYLFFKSKFNRDTLSGVLQRLDVMKGIRVNLQKIVRRKSANTYVPRFFNYTIDRTHRSSKRIKDVPDYVNLKLKKSSNFS